MENKETLKEVAKEIFKEEYICNGIDIAPAWREGFVTGAEWQAERMYSEEEVRHMLWELGDALFNNCQEGIEEGEPETYFDIIINEFKKTKDGK
jgi:transcription initiation factor IIE alpha subunit